MVVVVVVVVSVGAERWDVAAPRRNTLRARNGKAAIKPAGVYGVYASRSILLKFIARYRFVSTNKVGGLNLIYHS